MADVPLVSVLMSVHNGEQYLREAIESILNQTFDGFEFLIINDGSTDRSVEIIQSYYDPRIRLVHNETQLHLSASLNKGLDLARGEYIARMDADDISLPQRLARQVDFLDAHPEVGVLGSAFRVIDERGNPGRTKRFSAEQGFLRWCLCFHSPIAHPTVMMRTGLLRKVSGYRTDIRYAQDYDLWRRLSRITHLSNLQEVLLLYRHHKASTTKEHSTEQRSTGIRASQLLMSETLGENVPLDLVRRIRNRDLETSEQVRQAARVIYKLWLASDAADRVTPIERKKIRKDAARRLYLLVRPRLWGVGAWQVLGLAFCLDPSLLCQIAKRLLRRVV